jgi:hypothetical protein
MSYPVDIKPTIAETPTPNGDAPHGSVLAHLRERAAEQQKVRTIDLKVGGAFGESLSIRYGVLGAAEVDRYAEIGDKVGNTAISADMMVSCARTVIGRLPDGTEEDLHIGLTTELLVMLGLKLPPGVEELTPEEVVMLLFGGMGVAINEHAQKLFEFQQGGTESPGESSAPTS